MGTDESKARGTHPTDAVVLLRRPERALRYGLVRRMSDAWAGRRDGVVDLRALNTTSEGSSLDDAVAVSRRWLARNEATFVERDHREFLAAQAAVASLRAHLSVLEAALETAATEVRRLRAARDAMTDQPSPDTLTRRGPAEGADPDAVIAMRRRADHHRVLAHADTTLAQATAGSNTLREEHARVTTTLNGVFEAQVTRSRRLQAFHLRREEVFLRGLRRVIIRRHPDPASLRLPAPGITIPAWTQAPCPWTTPTNTQPALRLVS